LLLEHFIAFYSQKYNFPAKRLSATALEELMAHAWPGNVRALRHAVERAVILSEGTTLEADDFSLVAERTNAPAGSSSDASRLDDIERSAIARALAQNKGNVSRAAAGLGLTRASLYRRKMKYGL
jgi:DNA-binding NtrC family response regulator